MSQFASLRAKTRAMETDCDALLTQFSDLVQNPGDSSVLEADIDANLAIRSGQVRELYDLSYEPGASSTMLHQTKRHSELLEEHRRALKRLKSQVSQERSRRTLLSSVRQDIQNHREGTAPRSGSDMSTEDSGDAEAYYGDEMNRIDRSSSLADTLLAAAYDARAEILSQQNTLKDIQRQMLRAASRIPGINTLIGKIHSRQKRNSLIFAGIIVVCVLFVIFAR